MFVRRLFACLFLLAAFPALAVPPPKVVKAEDGIFDAFKTHPLVGLGEWHGLAQMLDLYVALLRDPRFAKDVGNIVLEVGDAAQQGVIDRYVNGETVPYTELRKVWSDTVGWFPTVTYAGSINIYSTIRDVNAKLPPEQRIKVWLGEPPIDWSKIKTKADWDPLVVQRDTYPAQLIETEILAKGKKALLIYGTGHFGRYPDPPNLRALMDRAHPGALFTVTPYVGYAQKDCAARFERHIKGWPTPSLVTPIRGSTLEKDVWRKGCNAYAKPKEQADEIFNNSGPNNLGLNLDALLYLGPRKEMVFGPRDPDILLDTDYRAEMNRRMILGTGEPMGPPNTARNVPQPFFTD